MLYRDHQVIRGQITRVWTKQEMSEAWGARVRSLSSAPSLEVYLRDYREVTIYLRRARHGSIYEDSLSPSALGLTRGDVVRIDMGMRSRAPLEFGDLAMVTTLICRASNLKCLEDQRRSGMLGQ